MVDVVPSETWTFGAPAGGSVVPSRSAGSRPPYEVVVLKHCWVAAVPASIAARSMAQDLAPLNVLPEKTL